MDFEFKSNADIWKELEDMLDDYCHHKTSFETAEDPDIDETRFRLSLVLDLIPRIKASYYHLRREATNRDDFEKVCASFIGSYGAFVGKMQRLVGPLLSPPLESTRIHRDHNSTGFRSSRVKFPPINLPVFNGSLDNWIEFRDKYESLVHRNVDFSNIEKFHYLHSAVQLPAGQQNVLQSFPLSEAAYEEAWKAVRERYDDKRKLKSQQFNTLLTVKKMSGESSVELRRILDSFSTCFTALDLLGATNDDFRVHVVQYRLDEQTLKDWQKSLGDDEATWPLMKDFLTRQWRTLDSVPATQKRQQPQNKFSDNKPSNSKPLSSKAFPASNFSPPSCTMCKEPHNLYQCQKFQALTIKERFDFATEKSLCRNCLSSSHQQRNCTSQNRCRVCKKNHHSMLHFEKSSSSAAAGQQQRQQLSSLNANSAPYQPLPPPRVSYPVQDNGSNDFHSSVVKTFVAHTEALLCTVSMLALDSNGEWVNCRALLDSGSQSNYMRTEFAERLGINLISTCIPVTGINGQASVIKKRTTAFISSNYKKFHGNVDCSVSDDITGFLPNRPINVSSLKIPSNLFLADPKFHEPGQIDMLLGTGIFHKAQLGNILSQPTMPQLTETKFGWTVGGEFPVSSPNSSQVSCFSQFPNSELEKLDEKLDKFMEIENFGSTKKILSPEEIHCVNHYNKTTFQDDSNRYITGLPVKSNIDKLGSNWANASRQFFYQEKKRMEDLELNSLYVAYMTEFINSGHMTEIHSSDRNSGYFLPHHGVKRISSTTTKLRPVFNASSKSETGISLNDCLCVGPMVQPESFDILLRFRERLFVLKSDIEKMYRQVFIDKSQRILQKILWRSSPSEPLRIYQLNTVTFGVNSAPFLATNTLNRIADDNIQFPEAAAVIKSSFYVDDLLFSFDTIEEGLWLRDLLRKILGSAKMPLRKWSSNNPELLKNLPKEDVESTDDASAIIKALGLVWNPVTDTISFSMKPVKEGPITKASLLSEIASIYDPIGLIGPVILRAKLHMKPLQKLKWTEEVPEDEKRRWIDFRSRLGALNDVNIERHAIVANPVSIQLHGFSDASEEAYGAAVYLRSCDALGNVSMNLICSKSRVSPPKQKSIARLELCAALLLSKLVSRIIEILSVRLDDVTLWSDSMITLYWIATEPSRLSTFVGNRVASIREHSSKAIWKHILGKCNPADLISRGLFPEEIINCYFWWNGPKFFTLPSTQWPKSLLIISDDDPEIIKESRKTFVVKHDTKLFALIETRFSDIKKLINCFAFIRRFIVKSSLRKTGAFSIEELDVATLTIIRIVQETLLPVEYKFFIRQLEDPTRKEKFPSKSSFLSLSPFMDDDRVIKVGGRVQASPGLTSQQKHQVILPRCHFSKLIIRDMHKKNLHPGLTAMLSFIREYYWPLGAKSIIRQVQRECLLCFRCKPLLATQFMGNLPEARVTMTAPFTTVAVDYAGHFNLRASLTKKASIVKAYIAMFKCMSSGAIHLELVTSLSTPAFITAFDRFSSRRGLSIEIFSDNGTEFVGANNEFSRILKEIEPQIGEHLKEKRIRWHFTTPVAPHAGGYYESGIKTMKHHLKRECADHSFDYEQFSTLLCKIEAVINSRPLMPMSEDPTDLQVLTPAHFLIGRSLIAKPERNFIPVNIGRLDRFNKLQQIQQKFWASWYHDYLHHLQTRPNNFRQINEFRVNDMVLVRDQNLPPLKWLIGRVIATFPDKSGVVRRVRVKTPSGDKDRHVKYLCFLPFESS